MYFPSSLSAKLLPIEALRALAAIMVVITHVLHEIKEILARQSVAFNEKMFPGDAGVDIFFVISGFIMVYVSRRSFGDARQAWPFIKRRIARIVPLYWILTLMMLAAVVLLPGRVDNETHDVWHWISSFLFFPYERATDEAVRPLLGVGWTLQYEMFFYLLFAGFMALPFHRACWSLVGLLTLIVTLGWLFEPESVPLVFWSNVIILEFGIGILLGLAYQTDLRLPTWVFWPMIGFGLVLLGLAPPFTEAYEPQRVWYYGIPAFFLVAAVTMTRGGADRYVPSWFVLLGASSYALYLSHPFAIGIATLLSEVLNMTELLEVQLIPVVFAGVIIPFCIAVGVAVHLFIERPIARYLSSRRRNESKPIGKGMAFK